MKTMPTVQMNGLVVLLLMLLAFFAMAWAWSMAGIISERNKTNSSKEHEFYIGLAIGLTFIFAVLVRYVPYVE